MNREEFEELICDKLGMWLSPSIESLAKELERLFKSSLSLPPAEGAEAFVKSKGLNLDYVKGIQLFLNPKYTVIDLMTEFAAQQQPTAEGAEEILAKHGFFLMAHKDSNEEVRKAFIEPVLSAMTEFATLHAQRIADKMVSERLREELIAYDKWAMRHLNGSGKIFTAEGAVDEYLKSRWR